MIRTRLTIWNCVVLALVLAAIGVGVYLTTRGSVVASIDRDLLDRAQIFGNDWPGPLDDRRGPPPDMNPMDPNQARREGIDPRQLRQVQAMNAALRPMILKLDGTDIMFKERKPWSKASFEGAKRGEPTFADVMEDGVSLCVLSVPIQKQGKILAVAQIATAMNAQEEALGRLAGILEIVLPLAVVVMLLTGVVLTRRALRPISQIASAAGRIEATNLKGRLPVQGKDEFAHLSATFNTMLDRLEVAFQEKDEAIERQRRFTADASHELKTPLTAIQARTGIALQRDLAPGKYREHLEAIDRAAGLMTSVVRDLLLLAASDDGRLVLHTEEVALREVVNDALAAVDLSRHVVDVDVPEQIRLMADSSALTRVLVNLLENSARHTPAGKRISVSGSIVAGRVVIIVSDEGEGIPADHVALVFNRFHRVDSARDRNSGGSGLGLAIAKAIVEAHGGSIRLESPAEGGTVTTIELPTVARASS